MIQKQTKENEGSNLMVNSIKYDLVEDPFVVPILFKKQVPLNKNIFELNEPLPKNYSKNIKKNMIKQQQMHDPLMMDQATMKLILIEKMNSYLSVFSIMVSLYSLYAMPQNQQIVQSILWVSLGLTLLLMIQIGVGVYIHYENTVVRRGNDRLFIVWQLLKVFMVLMAPNPWILRDDNILHLTILLRLYFLCRYGIVASMYFDPRAARITNLYGIKSQYTFWFAVKVIANQKNVTDVLLIYFIVVIFFSHCLYIVSVNMEFIQCFQIVIATLPTIGYGQYTILGRPRMIVYLIMLTGVQLNAFVTFVVLKQFEMTTGENNSFILMEKLKMVEELQCISSNFIIRKIKNRKGRKNFLEQRVHDDSFKKNYAEYKMRYRNLNPPDSIYQFNYFKQMLNDFKIKMLQTNNMVNTLLSKLSSHFKGDKRHVKCFQPQND